MKYANPLARYRAAIVAAHNAHAADQLEIERLYTDAGKVAAAKYAAGEASIAQNQRNNERRDRAMVDAFDAYLAGKVEL